MEKIITPYTKYALLSQSDYLKLNKAISQKLGYNLELPTERYAPINPRTTAGEAPLCVLELTIEVQEKCADLLDGLTLVDNGQWTIAEEQPTMIEAIGLTTEQVDWTLNHTAVTHPNLEVIYLLDSPPSPDAEQAIQQIVAHGTTVIVSDESN